MHDAMLLESTVASKLRKITPTDLAINPWLGVSYDKARHSQPETSIRLLYPQSGASYIGSIFLTLR